MSAVLWRFEALDTWFFRESRPHGAVGASELASLFPPPARTVAGAVRTLIGEAQGVDWRQFPQHLDYAELRDLIGDSHSLGRIALRGPFLMQDGERLYPAPLHLLEKRDGNETKYVRLRPGTPVQCDLGQVRLPALVTALPGAKPLEQVWLTGSDLGAVLAGSTPKNLYRRTDLFSEEPRLGIARDNRCCTVEKGLLYQTRHIRLHEGVSIGVGVSGPATQPADGVLRFGGEGRPAAVRIGGACPSLPVPTLKNNQLLLMLLTHADFNGAWLPPDFVPEQHEGNDCWRGELAGVELTIHSACLGKPAREGGWDLATGRPRAVSGLIPAGSVYFCTVAGDPQQAADRLHGAHSGLDTNLGRGELAVGLWQQ